MDEGKQRPKGGARRGAGAKPKWKTGGKTKLVRIPVAIVAEVLEAAKAIDAGKRLILPAKRAIALSQQETNSAPKTAVSKRRSHWIEKYSRKRGFRTHSYYRYVWNEGNGASNHHKHIPGGNAESLAVQKNLALVKEAMGQRKTVQEILQLIESMPPAPKKPESKVESNPS